jgi:hypothetical protein
VKGRIVIKDILGIELNSVKGFFWSEWVGFVLVGKSCVSWAFQKHIFLFLSSSFSMVFFLCRVKP